MSLTPLRLTTKTSQEMLADARRLIPQITSRWTDFNEADIGMVILAMVFGVIEARDYELDIKAAETTTTYVKQRKNAVRLYRLIGYRFKRSSPASTTLRFSLSAPQPKPVPLYPYWDSNAIEARTRGSAPLPFVLTQFAMIPVGSSFADVAAIQGRRTVYGPFVIEPVANRIVSLPDTDIADEAVAPIYVKINGVFWTVVQDWIKSKADSPHVQVETTENGIVRLIFGDGIFGLIPSGSLEVVYVRTLGETGNFTGTNRVTSLGSVMKDPDGLVISPQPSVTNLESASGGGSEETLAHAKKQASREYAAQNRGVTKRDLDAKAESYPGILQAKSFDINDVGASSFVIDYFQTKIPIVPRGNVLLPTAALKRGLQTYIESLKISPDNIEVIDPQYVPVTVSVDLYVKKPPYVPVNVQSAVQAAILDFFKIAESPTAAFDRGEVPSGVTFGESISYLQLAAAIQAVPGVAFISAISPNEDIAVSAFEIAILAGGSPVVNVLGVV